ncbi:MAG: hypothetical protein JXA71_11230 [Chitinispirillaceae bacterium]|nr:hypothetical protein [Chitinispirillaceae bacterium]
MVRVLFSRSSVVAFSLFIACMVATAGAQRPVFSENGAPTGLINMNPDPNGEPWIAGGLAPDEDPLDGLPIVSLGKSASSTPPPSKVDNTLFEQFRPIFNQSGGSCAQASAVGYMYTYEINVQRALASNTLENQYPYDFTYNFLNRGSGSNGSSQSGGWNIIAALGIPNAQVYGGFGLGIHNRWVSGYTVYYSGMANRLATARINITLSTPARVQEAKQWLFDRNNGSEKGGLLGFGSDVSGWILLKLATGTPEAGMSVVTRMGTGGGHAMTIGGYNDSVRYDYNNDGRYTNDVDINGDGVVDLKDWEIGAFLMINSWGTRFGTQGKAYIPYRLFVIGADSLGTRGSVTGITLLPELTVVPKLTFKVTVSHDQRSQVRIRAGYNTNSSASTPTGTPKTFSTAFNYAGGDFPMQGVNTDPIEIGLDVSDFYPRLRAAGNALFLLVDSRAGTGTVQRFSVLDYSRGGTPVEYVCEQTNVDLPVGATTLKVVIPGVGVIASRDQAVTQRIAYRNGLITLPGFHGEVMVYGLNGAKVLKKSLAGNGFVDVSSLPKGTYLAQCGTRMIMVIR